MTGSSRATADDRDDQPVPAIVDALAHGNGWKHAPAPWVIRVFIGALLVALVFPLSSSAFPLFVWILGACAFMLPRSDMLLCFGASLAATSFLLIAALYRSPAGALASVGIWISILSGLVGGPPMLWLSGNARRVEAHTRDRSSTALLVAAAIALASAVPLLLYIDPLEMNQMARVSPAMAAPLVGLAALLLTRRPYWTRALAFPLVMVAILPTAAATEAFRHRFVKDALVAPHHTINWLQSPVATVVAWPLREEFQTLELSPSGNVVVGRVATGGFVVLGPGSERRAVPARSLRIVDDAQVVGLFERKDGVEIRAYHLRAQVGANEPTWRLVLPSLTGMKLDINATAGTWQVRAPLGDATKVLSGTIGKDVIDETTHKSEPLVGDTRIRSAVAGGFDLVIRTVGQRPRPPEHERWDASMPVRGRESRTELWVADAGATAARMVAVTKLRLNCEPSLAALPTFICIANDDWESYVWRFGRAGEVLSSEPIVVLDGRISMRVGYDGTLAAKTYQGLVWIDPNRRLGIRFPYSRRPAHLFTGPEMMALGSGKIAVADYAQGTLSVYELP